MARIARATQKAKPETRGRTAGRPLSAAVKAKSPKLTKLAATSGREAAVPAPKPSKDELRARVEQLERANATLRAKSREATRAAKMAAARTAELEEQVARLEKQIAARSVPDRTSQPAAPAKGRRRTTQREIDPGDAVPQGVAVAEPAPADLEADVARDNLEAHLGTGDSDAAASADVDEAELGHMAHVGHE